MMISQLYDSLLDLMIIFWILSWSSCTFSLSYAFGCELYFQADCTEKHYLTLQFIASTLHFSNNSLTRFDFRVYVISALL